MSESLPRNHEHKSEQLEGNEKAKQLLESARAEAAKAEHQHKSKLEEIRADIETQAVSKEQKQQTSEQEPLDGQTYWNSREYRSIAYKQTLSKVRSKLSKRDAAVSRALHAPIVEKVADVSANTVARPSGLLGGSITACIASSIAYIIARRNGYDMTYSIFIFATVGGFVIGVVAEFAMKTIRGLLDRS